MSQIDAPHSVRPVSGQKQARSLKNASGAVFERLFGVVMSAIEVVINPIKRWIGIKRMAYLFLLPNMLIFSIFVLFPMALNFYYSLTGGTQLFPQDRPYVGTDNFETLFNCGNYLDPNTCVEDRFWRAVFNTAFFVTFQVGGMVLLALITALILNREIVGRGFFRSVFFYPVLLSPVVVALIWKWILQRYGLINAMLDQFGEQPVLFLLSATGRPFGCRREYLGATVLHVHSAGRAAFDPGGAYEAGQIDGANKCRASPTHHAAAMPTIRGSCWSSH